MFAKINTCFPACMVATTLDNDTIVVIITSGVGVIDSFDKVHDLRE